MLANLVLLLASLILSLGGLEVALRVYNPLHPRVHFRGAMTG